MNNNVSDVRALRALFGATLNICNFTDAHQPAFPSPTVVPTTRVGADCDDDNFENAKRSAWVWTAGGRSRCRCHVRWEAQLCQTYSTYPN